MFSFIYRQKQDFISANYTTQGLMQPDQVINTNGIHFTFLPQKIYWFEHIDDS